jgi:hypothetical protein
LLDAGWAQVAATVFLGLVGLWVAHNYRRQIRLKLAERQVDAYMKLWVLTALATPERTTPLDGTERQRLYDEMMRWYFEDGNGIFMSRPTRNLMVGVRSNLVCPTASIQPPLLAAELARLPEAEADRRRGCALIRQASLLRTQLETDLNMHFGFHYYSDLRPDDRAFLESCGLSPWRMPWRRRLFGPSGRAGPNPCVCGGCPAGKAATRRATSAG